MSSVAGIVGSGWVSNHSIRAVMVGSTLVFFHHAASSPQRWASRWWPRHSGTTNSSLALRPSARCCAKRRWWASAGRRPQIKHACLATNLMCSLSRKRRGSGCVSRLLSMPFGGAGPPDPRGRRTLPDGDISGGKGTGDAGWPVTTSSAASFAWNASSTCRASTSDMLFLAPRVRCAHTAASSDEATSLSSARSWSRNMADASASSCGVRDDF
jgi:hypothetical protein